MFVLHPCMHKVSDIYSNLGEKFETFHTGLNLKPKWGRTCQNFATVCDKN